MPCHTWQAAGVSSSRSLLFAGFQPQADSFVRRHASLVLQHAKALDHPTVGQYLLTHVPRPGCPSAPVVAAASVALFLDSVETVA